MFDGRWIPFPVDGDDEGKTTMNIPHGDGLE